MKKSGIIISACILLLSSCETQTVLDPPSHTASHGQERPQDPPEEDIRRFYVNQFAYDMMSNYYLWADEIWDGLESWMTDDDPIQKVYDIRYKDKDGKEIDKWTFVTNDYDSMVNGFNGTSTTLGMDCQLYYYDNKTTLCGVVTYTSENSPARLAGIKRGDTFLKINGTSLTVNNYSALMDELFYSGNKCTLTMEDGRAIDLSPINMYEEPCLLYKTFECGNKKVGYLVYNSFTMQSFESLIKAADYFIKEGIKELILDLRYNGGGFILTENALASMIAPEKSVLAEEIFETEIYNKGIEEAFGNDELRFTTEYEFTSNGQKYYYNTKGHNMNLDKLYVIMTGSSASASESCVCGLKAYMPVTVLGEQSYGKFCSGSVIEATEFFNDIKDSMQDSDYQEAVEYTSNWGMYYMISRYADKYGNTESMPDGISPDIEVSDVPFDGHELGDPEETMLAAALKEAGYVKMKSSGVPSGRTVPNQRIPYANDIHRNPAFGTRITLGAHDIIGKTCRIR